GGDLDVTGGQFGVLVALGPAAHLARDLHAVLGAQVVGVLLLPEDHLNRARGVAQVDEDHAAVVAAARHPSGQRHPLAHMVDAERPCLMGTDHESLPFRTSTTSASGTAVCSPVVMSLICAAPASRSRSPRMTAYLAPLRSAAFIAP